MLAEVARGRARPRRSGRRDADDGQHRDPRPGRDVRRPMRPGRQGGRRAAGRRCSSSRPPTSTSSTGSPTSASTRSASTSRRSTPPCWRGSRRARPGWGIEAYFAAWERAVAVFGEGQVSTYVILGMGEDPDLTVEGCKRAIDLGVYPFVVPLRPVPGSLMEDVAAAAAGGTSRRSIARSSPYLAREGMSTPAWPAGCARCQACSGLGAFERSAAAEPVRRAEASVTDVLPSRLRRLLRPAVAALPAVPGRPSCAEHHAIRHQVFVEEQASVHRRRPGRPRRRPRDRARARPGPRPARRHRPALPARPDPGPLAGRPARRAAGRTGAPDRGPAGPLRRRDRRRAAAAAG